MSSKPRRHFTTDEKATILRRHLADKVAVSVLCEEYKLQPSVFYVWQKQAFENLALALQPAIPQPSLVARDRRIVELEARLAKKDGVIAWVAEEHAKLKKSLGEP